MPESHPVLYLFFLCSINLPCFSSPRPDFPPPKRGAPSLFASRTCAGCWRRPRSIQVPAGSFPLGFRHSTSTCLARACRSTASMRFMPRLLSTCRRLWASSQPSWSPFPRTAPSSSSHRRKVSSALAGSMAMAFRRSASIPAASLSSRPARTTMPSGPSKRPCARVRRGSSPVSLRNPSISRKASA